MEKQIFRIPSIDGGLSAGISPRVVEPTRGYAKNLQNVDFTALGILGKRKGTASILHPLGFPINGCYVFTKTTTGVSYIVVAGDGKILVWNAIGNEWNTVISGMELDGSYDFITIADKVLLSNGLNEPILLNRPILRLTAGGLANTHTANDHTNPLLTYFRVFPIKEPPKGKYLEEYRMRAVIAGDKMNPSMIYLSHTGDPTLWNPTEVGSNAVKMFVSPDDGEGISGVLNMGSVGLLIGKPNALYTLFGYSRANMAVELVDAHVGVGSHKSMVFMNPWAYFVNHTGVFRYQGTDSPQKISNMIQDKFDQNVDVDNIEKTRAYQDGFNYVVCFPKKGGGTYTMVFNSSQEKWMGPWEQPSITEYTYCKHDNTTPIYFTEPGAGQLKKIDNDGFESTTPYYTLYLGGATGGSFGLGTDPVGGLLLLNYDVTSTQIQTGLEGEVGVGNVTVTGEDGLFEITFDVSITDELISSFVFLTGATNPYLKKEKPYVAQFESIDLDAGFPETIKDIGDIYITFRGTGSPYHVDVSFKPDYGSWVSLGENVEIDEGYDEYKVVRFTAGITVRYFSIKITSKEEDSDFSPVGISYIYRMKDVL